jgi:hypothetical protein
MICTLLHPKKLAGIRMLVRRTLPVINIPRDYQQEEMTSDDIIRRAAAHFSTPLFTSVKLARRFVEVVSRKTLSDFQIKC